MGGVRRCSSASGFTRSRRSPARWRRMQALTAARLLQALGGCAGMVIARAVVRDVTDERGAVRLMAQG